MKNICKNCKRFKAVNNSTFCIYSLECGGIIDYNTFEHEKAIAELNTLDEILTSIFGGA